MGDISVPQEPRPTVDPLVRKLTIAASGLTTASIAVNLMLQIVHFLKKRPIEPDQRDRAQAASLALTVLRQMPGLIKQVRLLASEIQKST